MSEKTIMKISETENGFYVDYNYFDYKEEKFMTEERVFEYEMGDEESKLRCIIRLYEFFEELMVVNPLNEGEKHIEKSINTFKRNG